MGIRKNIRILAGDRIGIFPDSLDGDCGDCVVFAVLLNDTGSYSDWGAPQYGEPIRARNLEELLAECQRRGYDVIPVYTWESIYK